MSITTQSINAIEKDTREDLINFIIQYAGDEYEDRNSLLELAIASKSTLRRIVLDIVIFYQGEGQED